MQIIVHADDFGLTETISDHIVDCFDGALRSTSIIVNGHSVDYAMRRYDQITRHDKRIGIHLNLLEGKPVLPAVQVPLLVDEDGYFCHSFVSLYLQYVLASRRKKQQLQAQIKAEVRAQLGKFVELVGGDQGIHVDSHQHFHMMPFVFASVVELADEFDIDYIRVSREKFFLHLQPSALKNYFGSNIIKHLLLNHLAKRASCMLQGSTIKSPDYFLGVLFTGNMDINSISKGLQAIANEQDCEMVEVLLHPGGAHSSEGTFWERYPALRDYYLLDDRQQEKDVLLSKDLPSYLS